MQDQDNGLSRRRMMALGALGGATLVGGMPSAYADGSGTDDQSKLDFGDPGGTRLGSALVGGYRYLYRQYTDFAPVDNSGRTFDTAGVWGTTQPKLYTAVELPFGAMLWSIEFYLRTSVDVWLEAALWRTQTAETAPIALVKWASKSLAMASYWIAVSDAKRGPYAPGSKLVVGVNNTSTDTRLNGVRIGYTRCPAGMVMLDKPVRAYDSRTGGGAKIGNGQTRIHSLASWIPAGATGAIVNLTVAGGEKSGGVALYSAGTTVPTGSALYWTSTTVSSELHTKVTSDRRIKVTMRGVPGSKCHYFYDVVGYTM